MYYPPVGFHFKVEVMGISPPSDDDTRFSEVSGLSTELTAEEVVEGGENRFVQKFPIRAKFPELVLKRGLLVNSQILNWIQKCIQELDIQPKDLVITLLNENREPLLTWRVVNAYPTKWSVSDMNAMSNTVVIETLQLYYQYFTLDRP